MQPISILRLVDMEATQQDEDIGVSQVEPSLDAEALLAQIDADPPSPTLSVRPVSPASPAASHSNKSTTKKDTINNNTAGSSKHIKKDGGKDVVGKDKHTGTGLGNRRNKITASASGSSKRKVGDDDDVMWEAPVPKTPRIAETGKPDMGWAKVMAEKWVDDKVNEQMDKVRQTLTAYYREELLAVFAKEVCGDASAGDKEKSRARKRDVKGAFDEILDKM